MSLRPAFLRDERVISGLVQLVVGVLAAALVVYVAGSVLEDLRARDLAPGLGFLENAAGFGIGEGLSFSESDSYGRAFVVGLYNTLRVAVVGVFLATVLGLVIALGRLSGNALVERLSAGYVEIFRNTPLLVQLIFWYQGVVLRLPDIRDSAAIGAFSRPDEARVGLVFLSKRGLALPRPVPSDSAQAYLIVLAAALLAAAWVWRWRLARQRRTGQPARAAAWAVGGWLAVAAVTWLALPEAPWAYELPAVTRFKYEGGSVLTPEFTALLVGLVTYSAAFISEVMRSGIQAVTRGQREAALAVGLSGGQVMRLVVLPQALRVIVPPLTNQYLNLTKNSSLAIYIGYPDLFNVGLTIGNNTGQFVVITAMIMAIYLSLSLLTSLVMNAYNRRIQLVER